MKRSLLLKVPLLAAATITAPVLHAAVVYSNGAIDGTNDSYFITNPESITNSFVSTDAAILTSVELGLFVYSGTPGSLQWQVGTTPFGSEISSGTASPANTFHNAGPFDGTTYDSTFTLTGLLPSAGTYYLTLSNGLSSDGTQLGWDENDGPSTVQGLYGGMPFTPEGSESFTLSGTSVVPEPSTCALLGLGAVLLGYNIARRRIA